MLAASLFGIFVIPMLYVVFQWLRERTARRGAAVLSQEGRGTRLISPRVAVFPRTTGIWRNSHDPRRFSKTGDRRPRDRAEMDARRQDRCRNRVFHIQPALVHARFRVC